MEGPVGFQNLCLISELGFQADTARQITLFEHGQPAPRPLTSDADSCPAGMLSFLKSRWRQENFLKYASQNHGIDKICHYATGDRSQHQADR